MEKRVAEKEWYHCNRCNRSHYEHVKYMTDSNGLRYCYKDDRPEIELIDRQNAEWSNWMNRR